MHSKKFQFAVLVYLCVMLTGVLVWADDPNESGSETICYGTPGTTEDYGSCPSWFWVFSRDGQDGGQLTVEVDGCQIVDFIHYPKPQGGGYGEIADLEINDIFIEWDEDQGHGDGATKYFEFTGTYEAMDPNDYEYVKVTTTDSRTEWTVYRVTSAGTLTKTGDCCNEHDAIHLQRNWLELSKTSDANDCVMPWDDITYTICWNNNSDYTFTDCYIIDWLPEGVTYPGGSWQLDPNLNLVPPDPFYDPNTHSYVYLDLGTIAPGDANCVTLDVVVNEMAVPGLYLHNVAELYSDDVLIARDANDVLVCCAENDPNIYVDITANGNDTGIDWQNAYSGTDGLQKALNRASLSQCGPFTIYVAQGTYDPNQAPDKSFVLPDGTKVYGGFRSGGCDFSQRNPKAFITILTGLIDEDDFPDADTIVTMGDETLLDGFTVAEALENAVYGNGVDFTVDNCVIKNSDEYGIYAKNGNATVKWCKVQLNDYDGIRHEGAGYTLTVENSWILRNKEYGVHCNSSTPTVKNSIISESDLAEFGRAGIRLYRPTYQPVLHNLTVSNNKAEGIYFEDDHDIDNDANNLDYPDIQNCIVYYNNNNGSQFSEKLGNKIDNVAKYCCIQDCNEVNNNRSFSPKFAYTVDPNGTPDPNNYHLAYDSNCIDAGSLLLTYTGQVDIDGEGTNRKYGNAVDIGADEVYSCDGDVTEDDISNVLDWNADGVVNLHEFSKFQKAWLSHDPNEFNDPNFIDPNDSLNWDVACNLDATGDSQYIIDLADLDIFWSDTPWLWEACWRDNYIAMYGMMSGGTESMMMAVPMMETMSLESMSTGSFEETDPYTEMSEPELVSFVMGIYEVIDSIETSINESHENADNLAEAKDFLEDVLSDIKASRQ